MVLEAFYIYGEDERMENKNGKWAGIGDQSLVQKAV
jgi:hypothetical protein